MTTATTDTTLDFTNPVNLNLLSGYLQSQTPPFTARVQKIKGDNRLTPAARATDLDAVANDHERALDAAMMHAKAKAEATGRLADAKAAVVEAQKKHDAGFMGEPGEDPTLSLIRLESQRTRIASEGEQLIHALDGDADKLLRWSLSLVEGALVDTGDSRLSLDWMERIGLKLAGLKIDGEKMNEAARIIGEGHAKVFDTGAIKAATAEVVQLMESLGAIGYARGETVAAQVRNFRFRINEGVR